MLCGRALVFCFFTITFRHERFVFMQKTHTLIPQTTCFLYLLKAIVLLFFTHDFAILVLFWRSLVTPFSILISLTVLGQPLFSLHLYLGGSWVWTWKVRHGFDLQETSTFDEIMEMTKRNTNRFGLGGLCWFGWQALISCFVAPFCTFKCNNPNTTLFTNNKSRARLIPGDA